MGRWAIVVVALVLAGCNVRGRADDATEPTATEAYDDWEYAVLAARVMLAQEPSSDESAVCAACASVAETSDAQECDWPAVRDVAATCPDVLDAPCCAVGDGTFAGLCREWGNCCEVYATMHSLVCAAESVCGCTEWSLVL